MICLDDANVQPGSAFIQLPGIGETAQPVGVKIRNSLAVRHGLVQCVPEDGAGYPRVASSLECPQKLSIFTVHGGLLGRGQRGR